MKASYEGLETSTHQGNSPVHVESIVSRIFRVHAPPPLSIACKATFPRDQLGDPMEEGLLAPNSGRSRGLTFSNQAKWSLPMVIRVAGVGGYNAIANVGKHVSHVGTHVSHVGTHISVEDVVQRR